MPQRMVLEMHTPKFQNANTSIIYSYNISTSYAVGLFLALSPPPSLRLQLLQLLPRPRHHIPQRPHHAFFLSCLPSRLLEPGPITRCPILRIRVLHVPRWMLQG